MDNYNARNDRYAQQCYRYDLSHAACKTACVRKCALYSKGNTRTSTFVKIMRFIYAIYKMLEKVFATEQFAAAFIGVSLVMIVGIVGGIQLGALSLTSGVVLSCILLSVISVFICKIDREG